MKRLLLLTVLMFLPGCAGCQNQIKHIQSDIVGLRRTITLYNAEGKAIRTWNTRAKVEDRGGTIWFLDDQGNAVTVSGSFVVEER